MHAYKPHVEKVLLGFKGVLNSLIQRHCVAFGLRRLKCSFAQGLYNARKIGIPRRSLGWRQS
jgi:hypothetical protein